jgi:putative two-component system response regulator
MKPQRILVVDDNDGIRILLEQLLTTDGHRVDLAHDGRDAMAQVEAELPDLIVTDLDMPHLNGFELCRRVRSKPATRLLPILMITGRNAQEAKLRAWELGADDFLTKPLEMVEVLARCRSLLRMKRLVDELDSAEAVVFGFARTVEAKCRYTWGHSERVTSFASALAQQVGLAEAEQQVLRKGAILHDIGKISIPDAILNKPSALTREEFAIIKQHPMEGTRIVEPLRSVRETIPLIRWHHERLDGNGYPDGLFGGAIPLMVRILAVADVFDAVSSERPYRPALPLAACLDILQTNAAGGGLDPELVRCFCEMQAAPSEGGENSGSTASHELVRAQ